MTQIKTEADLIKEFVESGSNWYYKAAIQTIKEAGLTDKFNENLAAIAKENGHEDLFTALTFSHSRKVK